MAGLGDGGSGAWGDTFTPPRGGYGGPGGYYDGHGLNRWAQQRGGGGGGGYGPEPEFPRARRSAGSTPEFIPAAVDAGHRAGEWQVWGDSERAGGGGGGRGGGAAQEPHPLLQGGGFIVTPRSGSMSTATTQSQSSPNGGGAYYNPLHDGELGAAPGPPRSPEELSADLTASLQALLDAAAAVREILGASLPPLRVVRFASRGYRAELVALRRELRRARDALRFLRRALKAAGPLLRAAGPRRGPPGLASMAALKDAIRRGSGSVRP